MNVLIIEDEGRIARRIERMIKDILKERLTHLELAESLESGIEKIKITKPDLLFLDLNLNGKDGFEILKNVVSESFHTIIISAYKERAITAFEYGVLDFVPKPFDQDRLAKACQRFTDKEAHKGQAKFLAVKKKGKRLLINISEILYIKGAGIYTELVLQNNRTEIHNKSLEALNVLLPDHFERIHKSYLVAMDQAEQIIVEPGSKYSLKLNGDIVLPIGRTRYKEIKEKWF